MNRPGTPLSVASEKRMSMPGVIMAAHAIIGTVLRKFPLSGTLSYSNWTFQLLSARVRRALGQASILGGRLHVCAKTSRVDGSRGWRSYCSPAGYCGSRAPRGSDAKHTEVDFSC